MEMWNIENVTGYKPKTTFWEDFVIAEAFGIDAIKDTFNRASKHWKHNVEYITELVMVLNWKTWRWYGKNDKFCEIYTSLYYELHEWCLDNLKGDDLTYYLRTTD